ncbi:integrase arm-type DNA-binding domain-containing protein [Robbsia sp. Bb-Pol-6]|uniref:Integrase arm-type DNA-binding domain-containing protein n=1 Tax=Robbsia betulipollinis TaxID=2981849 RepID=A0ABT3ZMW1_9BURK|nr:integrase arm-type DNA-binding domain-containing protein [Robbsia betulipollinis]MCY0387891.1 integrase arm-type DNA-binding domain-containing protein [Robbsia betulipollinis]
MRIDAGFNRHMPPSARTKKYAQRMLDNVKCVWNTLVGIHALFPEYTLMKLKLTSQIATNANVDRIPIEGEPVAKWPPNPGRKAYIITDASSDVPTGFGLKVTSGSSTYIVQRRVRASGPGAVIRATIGKVVDFTLQQARNRARELAHEIQKTGRAPGPSKRARESRDLTLGEVFELYRTELLTRKKPAKVNSFRSLDKAVRKLEPWLNKRVNELYDDVVIERFDEIANTARTTAEQTMRWASTAVDFAIERDRRIALRASTAPVLNYNPFGVLRGKYRSRQELEEQIKEHGKRAPLSLDKSLGPWLQAIFKRRGHNRTGCDYLLLATLWGCRSAEASDLMWRDKISEEMAKHVSFIDLDRRLVLLRDTKNGLNHTLPLAHAATKILRQRQQIRDEEAARDRDPFRRAARIQWVFPPSSVSRLRKSPHYKDSKSLRAYLCRDAGIIKWSIKTDPNGNRFQVPVPALGMHDLRRTFAGVTDALHLTEETTKRFLNHFVNARSQTDQRIELRDALTPNVAHTLMNTRDLSNVTNRYTEVEEGRLREAMQSIETTILTRCPALYNLLMTPDYPPMQVWVPTPLEWPKPRASIEVRDVPPELWRKHGVSGSPKGEDDCSEEDDEHDVDA